MYSATLSNSTGIISGRHMITLKAEIENKDWTGIKLNIDSEEHRDLQLCTDLKS